MGAVKLVAVKLVGDSDKIWNEIKDVKIDIFSLPGQTVKNHCEPLNVDPTKLFVKPKSSAVLPVLEEAIGSKFSIELAKNYLIISRKV